MREVEEETGVRMEVDRLGFVSEVYFYGDAPSNKGKLVYEITFFFYMKVPDDFMPVEGDLGDEKLRWVSPEEAVTVYPVFLKGELSHPENLVKHFVYDERNCPAVKIEKKCE